MATSIDKERTHHVRGFATWLHLSYTCQVRNLLIDTVWGA